MDYETRRLPVYILVDCSSSMSGEPIEAVKQGLRALISELQADPQTAETAYISVITFSSIAQQIVPLTALRAFREIELTANGATALGKALTLLTECIERDVRQGTAAQAGDYKPLVFLLTDGAPTDAWQAAAERLKGMEPANIVACAAGAKADVQALKQLTGRVVMMNTLSAGDLAEYFNFVSETVQKTAAAFGEMEPPPPPSGFTVLP